MKQLVKLFCLLALLMVVVPASASADVLSEPGAVDIADWNWNWTMHTDVTYQGTCSDPAADYCYKWRAHICPDDYDGGIRFLVRYWDLGKPTYTSEMEMYEQSPPTSNVFHSSDYIYNYSIAYSTYYLDLGWVKGYKIAQTAVRDGNDIYMSKLYLWYDRAECG